MIGELFAVWYDAKAPLCVCAEGESEFVNDIKEKRHVVIHYHRKRNVKN